MKRLFLFALLLLHFTAFAQQKAVISGYVYDRQTGEVIIGATVAVENQPLGTMSNQYGFYSLPLPKGTYTIVCSFLGYQPQKISLKLTKDTVINFYLKQAQTQIQEVTVVASKKVKSNEYQTVQLTPLTISQLPIPFGENDPIKAIQLQTGVKTIGDGATGFYVQGGNIDQNLILIDEAPVYNPAHLFGLVSVINPDAVKSIRFYKGSIPARYGGRLSSVMDIKLDEGNSRQFQVSGGASILAARLTLQGPIIKDKASFLFSARRSFLDFFMKPDLQRTLIPKFYDLNFKTNLKINHKNRLFFSVYQGHDQILSVGDFTNVWGNRTATLRFNHIFSPRLFSNISLIFSDYQNTLQFTEQKYKINWTTGIRDYTLKTGFTFAASPKNKLEAGTMTIFHNFTPGQSDVSFLQSIPQSQALENAVYILNDLTFGEKFGINYGLRFSVFQNVGKAEWYDYDENYRPIRLHTNQTGVYNTYKALEPRISLNFYATQQLTVKAAYSRTIQYISLLQNNAYGYTSLETWIPASPNIKPLKADIASAGLEYEFSKHLKLFVNTYYKLIQNQIDYIDHARIVGVKYIETQIRAGQAKAYGTEITLQKTAGKLTATVSYNYSRVILDIPGINNNKPYPANYDIPNDIRILLSYSFNKRIKANLYWIYTTGRPFTMPAGYFVNQGYYVPLYSDRNGERMPDYHRLDVSVTIDPKPGKKLKSYWKLGVYNLYARQNPLGYYFEYIPEENSLRVYQYSFITIMPIISYGFKF